MKKRITHVRLLKLLRYNKSTGLFRWRVQHANCMPAGSIAGGSDCDKGYWRIKVDGVLYRASRLAWFYVKGKWPKHQIDHKNLKRNDDRWCNLREATNLQNKRNSAKRNSTGFKCVCKLRNGTYNSSITVSGDRIHLGTYKRPEEAHAAYVVAAKKHFGKFARFELR